MMKNKILILTGIVITFLGAAYWLSTKFAPGSYPYAEVYKINVSEENLIKEIASFKKDNTQYCVPVQVGLVDGRTDSSDFWFHIYFYYPKEHQILYTWVRAENKNTTTFAFVAINDGLILGKWKDINNDFSRGENEKQIKKFEALILSKIKEQIRR